MASKYMERITKDNVFIDDLLKKERYGYSSDDFAKAHLKLVGNPEEYILHEHRCNVQHDMTETWVVSMFRKERVENKLYYFAIHFYEKEAYTEFIQKFKPDYLTSISQTK